MGEWWLLWAWRIIAVLGLGGVLIWMGKTIKAMKDTVGAQKETIRAQTEKMTSMETLLNAMETVLTSTDERNMLARLEAHKKFVEHEKEAREKTLVDNFAEERKKLTQLSREALEDAYGPFRNNVIAFAQFATNALPYVPRNRRGEFINSLDLTHLPELKTQLDEIASSAPDLSVGGSGGFGSISHFGGSGISRFGGSGISRSVRSGISRVGGSGTLPG